MELDDFLKTRWTYIKEFRAADKHLGKRIKNRQQENEELKLFLAALIELLLKKEMITPQELAQCVMEIDMSDGVADGQADVELTPTGPKKNKAVQDFMDSQCKNNPSEALNDLANDIENKK